MRKKALAALLALSMLIPNGIGANIASAASSNTEITVNSMESTTTTDAAEVISGKISSSKTVANVNYKATSEDGEVYAENTATVNGEKWSVDDLLLRPGNNTITITAKTSDGKKTTTSVDVNYDNGSFEEITEVDKTADGTVYANEQLVVMFKSETSQERCQEIIQAVGGEQIGVLYAIDQYQVRFQGADAAALKQYIKKFQAYDEVIVADYNYVNEISALPNDPWGGDNEWTERDPEGYNWGMEAIHAVSAWEYQDKLSLTSDKKAQIKVGICDSGFDMDHEDLELTAISSYMSEHYHGTHVAGTIGGIGNNGSGVTGVLWNADTIVIPNMGVSYAVELIQNGAKVVNCSWGLIYPSESAGKSGGVTAANAMAKLLEEGYDFLVVQSAGNDTLDSTWNGSFAGITEETALSDSYNVTIEDIMNHKVIVGAANNLGSNTYKTAYFSNYGKYVDVVAPGVDIYSSKLDNTYGLLNGTSMAAPHVTGSLAYIWSLNPTLPAAEVKNIMLSNTSITVEDYSAASSGIDSYPMIDLYLASKAVVDRGDEGTAVYFDNSASKWKEVYAYVWSDGIQARVLPTTLVDSVNKIYKVTVPYNYKKIIFKDTEDGWVTQTGDLFVPTDKNNCWRPDSASNRTSGSWYPYTGSIATPTPTTIAPMPTTTVKFDNSIAKWDNVYAYAWNNTEDYKLFCASNVTNNIYTFEISGSYSHLLFKNTGDTTSWILQTNDLEMPEDSKNCYKPSASYTKADGVWYDPSEVTPPAETETPTPSTEVVFYYTNAKTNWSKVYAYVWGTGVSATTYEGTKVATNVYQFKIPKKYTKVLFKNTSGTSSWDKQTDDILIQSANGYIFEPNSSSNKTSGSWKTYSMSTETPTPATKTPTPATKTPTPATKTPTPATKTPTPATKTPTPATKTPTPATKTPTPSTEVVFYYNNTKTNWSKVYAYVWGTGVSATTYEGTKVATNVYQFKVPQKYTKVLFKNTSGTSSWDKQTDDTLIQSTNGYIFVPSSSSNKTSGSWESYNIPTVAPTTVAPTTVPPTPTPTYQSYVTVDFDNSVSGWDNVYAYVWNTTEDYQVFTAAYVSGTHVLFNITGSYKYILFKNKEDGWDQQTADLLLPEYTTSAEDKCFKPYNAGNKSEGTWGKSTHLSNRKAIVPSVLANEDTVAVGDAVNFIMKAEYENGHYKNSRSLTFVYEDGTTETVNSFDSSSYTSIFTKISENTYTYAWTPSKTGKVKVKYSVNQNEDHAETSQSITIDVKAKSNTVKIYYKKSSWSAAYVHYKVNGTWTKVPGEKMQPSDRSDYAWMYVIDLGDTTNTTLCFNNGNGSWDNNNNANYTVQSGTYGISGNVVTKLK